MIRAILFDADGVIQHADDFAAHFMASFEISPGQAAKLVRDILEAEVPALTGAMEIAEAMAPVFRRHALPFDETAFRASWHNIQTDRAILAIIAQLRAGGYHCALASNQDRARAAYMSEGLGYAALFDAAHYSCHIGHAKPSPAYFHAVRAATGMEAASILFIDDRPANIDAARQAGLHAAHFQLPREAAGEALAALLRGFGISL